MREKKKAVEDALSEAMRSRLDAVMGEHGFSRLDGSLEYSRAVSRGSQRIKMAFDLDPTSDANAIALLLPHLTVTFPEVNEIALEMAGGDTTLIGSPDITFGQQLHIAAPKDQHVYWYIYDTDSVIACIESIRTFVQTWIIPFLNDYTEPASLVQVYEKSDGRVLNQRHFYIYVAATYVLLRQPANAIKVLETKFGRPGARREYAKAFEYVENLLARAQQQYEWNTASDPTRIDRRQREGIDGNDD